MTSRNFEGFSHVDVKVATLLSIPQEKTVPLTRMMTKLEIYGTVFDPTMVAVFYLNDTSGILQRLPMVGEEVIELEIETPGNEPLQKVFFVHKVSDISFDPNGSASTMRIDAVSIEQVRATSTNVDMGARDQISNMVKNILKDIVRVDEQAKVNVEDTEGIETFVLPGWNAWETIAFLKRRAVSTRFHSPYLFFEDTKGFNFISVEALIEQKKKDKPPENYTSAPFQVEASLDPQGGNVRSGQKRNVENLQIVSKASTIEQINNGGMRNTIQAFNLLRKEVVETQTTYDDLQTNVKAPLDDTFKAQHSARLKDIIGTGTRRVLIPSDVSNVTSSVNNFGRREMFLRQIADVEVGFDMYGNSSLDPGDLIHLETPLTTGNQEEDAQLTGNYIITSFCHHITSGNMMTAVEAFRFGVGTSNAS